MGRSAAWGLDITYEQDDADGPDPYTSFEPAAGPVAAKGGGGGNTGGGKTGGGGGGSGSAPTDITITNGAIDENSAAGTLVGTFGAADADNRERFTFALLDDAGGRFAISGGGKLVVADGTLLDYETGQTHTILVQVTDKQGHTFQEWMTISVNDLVEAVNAPPTDMQLSGTSIPEGSGNGALVGVMTTTDPDLNETFTYTLLDSAGGRFVIDGDRIEIGNSSLIDFETAASHDVTVRVTDSSGNSYVETFTIAIEDVNGLAEQPGYIQALIPAVSGEAYYFWPDGDSSTAPTTITVAILSDFPSYYDPYNMPYTGYTTDAVAFDQLASAQITVIHQLLAELSELVNVEFVEVGSAAQANITFGMYQQDVGIGAFAWYASGSGATGTVSGDVWLNSYYDTTPTTSETSGADWARSAIAHELGHAMGLKHPGDYNAGGGGTDGPYLDAAVDNNQYTVMSYYDFPYSSWDPVDYMLYDIAALQYLYGANKDHATGNDVYAFNTGSNLIDTIWDAGGFDTFSAAGATTAVTIDLNQGAFSSIGLTNNIAIAYGAEIEAAVGGAGTDTLIGNGLANTFTGGGGADRFAFLDNWGTDTVTDFEVGLDHLDLSATGLAYADLSIGNGGAGAEIAAGGSTIVLAGIDAGLIDNSDFFFA